MNQRCRDPADLNFSYLDRVLDDLSSHAGSDPPHFDTPEDLRTAATQFASLLRLMPQDANANYLYGKFLAETARPADALPLLEKAKSLGAVNADYTLGLTYLLAGDKAKALENLEHYAKRVPADENAAKTIDAVRKGNVTTKSGPPPGSAR